MRRSSASSLSSAHYLLSVFGPGDKDESSIHLSLPGKICLKAISVLRLIETA